jgi:trehalose 6-phosphate synthase
MRGPEPFGWAYRSPRTNPYDTHAMGEAILLALLMPSAEQRARMRVMRDIVRIRNVHRWAGQMLLDAAQLRRREEILAIAAQERDRSVRRGSRRGGRLVQVN